MLSLTFYGQSLAVQFERSDSDTNRAHILALWGEEIHRSKPDSAIILFESALHICERNLENESDPGKRQFFQDLMNSMYNNLGYMYERQGLIELALECNDKAIRAYERNGDTLNLANSLNNVGYIYFKQEEYALALEYYERSELLKDAIGDLKGLAQTLNNIGLLYKRDKQYNKAFSYYERSLNIRRSIPDSLGIANSLANIGSLYKEMRDYTKAIDYYMECITIQMILDDRQGMAGSKANIGTIYFEQGDLQTALVFGERSLEYGQELGYPENIKKSAHLLYEVHQAQGDHEKALEYYQLFIIMRDSVLNTETQAATIRQQVQYEYEKEKLEEEKEREKQQAIDEEHRKTLQVITYSVSGGLGLVLLFSIFLINRVRVINRQKGVIEEQKHEVEEKNAEITDSLNYASTIQKAILTSHEYLDEMFKEHFVLYQPQSIVSGDFYWAFRSGHKMVWAAVDCTGHGVPGAFMSMIGTTLLNEIVVEKGITQPSQILDLLRQGVIKALEKSSGKTERQDGMDMALCVLDSDTNELIFSGANNPLWIINKAGEVIEIKGDKMPVGLSDSSESFSQHAVKVDDGSMIYIFSDGYADQFGGPHGKKFKYKTFKELLGRIRDLPAAAQQAELFRVFEEWKGDVEQTDDVCVFGVRVTETI